MAFDAQACCYGEAADSGTAPTTTWLTTPDDESVTVAWLSNLALDRLGELKQCSSLTGTGCQRDGLLAR